MIKRYEQVKKEKKQAAPKMTEEQAKTFEQGRSLMHEVILAEAAHERGCSCEAYEDWFTYRRWQAIGMQVQKGERGVKLTTYKTIKKEEDGKDKSFSVPTSTTVFCRCQVKPIA